MGEFGGGKGRDWWGLGVFGGVWGENGDVGERKARRSGRGGDGGGVGVEMGALFTPKRAPPPPPL